MAEKEKLKGEGIMDKERSVKYLKSLIDIALNLNVLDFCHGFRFDVLGGFTFYTTSSNADNSINVLFEAMGDNKKPLEIVEDLSSLDKNGYVYYNINTDIATLFDDDDCMDIPVTLTWCFRVGDGNGTASQNIRQRQLQWGESWEMGAPDKG